MNVLKLAKCAKKHHWDPINLSLRIPLTENHGSSVSEPELQQ